MNKFPKGLIAAIQNKALIPIVGAGVSQSVFLKNGQAAFPGWEQLLRLAAAALKEEAEEDKARLVEGFLAINDYQRASEMAYLGLAGPNWNNFFKRQFDLDLSLLNPASAALPQAIWRLSTRIITLNYDKILQWCQTQSAQIAAIDNGSTAELADFQKGIAGHRVVWHLHGRIDNCGELIFTPQGYHKLYATGEQVKHGYEAALRTLQAMSVTHSFLFVGCSLDDAALLSNGQTGPHYALVHKEQLPAIETKLNGTRIKLIAFEDFGEPLLTLIEELASTAATVDHIAQAQTQPEPEPEPEPIKPSAEAVKSRPRATKSILLLTADPLDEPLECSALLQEFAHIACPVVRDYLSLENLKNCGDYDYLLLVSRVSDNCIIIEDDALCRQKITFLELEQAIGHNNIGGVFIFVDKLPNQAQVCDLSLPTLIVPTLEKSQRQNLAYQLFNKKNDLHYFKPYDLLNTADFKLQPLADNKASKGKTLGKTKQALIQNTSPLALSIDPNSLRNFVGKQHDLKQICGILTAFTGQNDILTLKGSGGMGKTTLIKKLCVALAQRAYYAGGIYFVDCEPIADCEHFIHKVAECFNLEQAQDCAEHLQQHFDQQARLIILDNAESLLKLKDAARIKTQVSFFSQYASIIITSREALGLSAETVYEMQAFTNDEAFELYCQVSAPREMTAKELKLLRQDILEDLLANNPLAIKLITGNRPKVEDLAHLKKELEANFFAETSQETFNILDLPADAERSRERSIYGSILYSYRQLNAAEQQVFELLSLFPDGINLESFQRLNRQYQKSLNQQKRATQPNIISSKIIRALQDKSLVEHNSGHFKLQSIIGKFAEAQLRKREHATRYYQAAFQLTASTSKG